MTRPLSNWHVVTRDGRAVVVHYLDLTPHDQVLCSGEDGGLLREVAERVNWETREEEEKRQMGLFGETA